MTPQEVTRALLEQLVETRDPLGADMEPCWVLDKLKEAWRDAQVQATLAYEDWRSSRGAHAYAVYRAAQDRADAAQDMLRSRRGPKLPGCLP
jgi:hypothetical protein